MGPEIAGFSRLTSENCRPTLLQIGGGRKNAYAEPIK